MPIKRFILRPLDRVNSGTGHMRRLYRLAIELNQSSEELDCVLVVDNPAYWTKFISGFPGSVHIASSGHLIAEGCSTIPTIILFDQKETPLQELRDFSRLGMPVLLDDNGPGRFYAPLVLDSIPGPRCNKANQASIAFLTLPQKLRQPDPGGNILVSFGSQDPGNLRTPVLDFLLNDLDISPARIAVTGCAGPEMESAVHLLKESDTLQPFHNRLHHFGLVICSYGLTAFEALAAGCTVVTVDPSPYHVSLSKQTGFKGIGHYRANSSRFNSRQKSLLKSIVQNYAALIDTRNQVVAQLNIDLDSHKRAAHPSHLKTLILSFSQIQRHCRACHHLLPRIMARFPYRSYYRCPRCGMMGLFRFDNGDDNYGPDYFSSEYCAQYGRTYMEDYQTIKTMGQSRIGIIKHFQPSGALLDIGCAFGPFLHVAYENSFDVYGIDISQTAVDYVRNHLGVPALCGDFLLVNPDIEFKVPCFDIVTLWYVIEHFQQLESILTRLADILAPGGILAFSTPNGAGVSAWQSLNVFLENSPVDHYTIWTPQSARKLLNRHGFKIVRIRITGHHPERIFKRIDKDGFLYKILMFLSQILKLGDTFEIYAVKG